MKKAILFLSFFAFVFAFSVNVKAQKQIEPKIDRDPMLEADAMHNLEVSRQYFKLKKAYLAVKMRLEETIAANPNFSRMDEVLYLLGMSNYYLSEGKGKQKVKDDKTRLREDAVAYLAQMVEQYPQSEFKAPAEKTLKLLQSKK